MDPFLKWAGGKRWLFTEEFRLSLPPFKRYVEPFLGGAAGFFAISPQKALLSDINSDLIDLYEVVRDEPSTFKQLMLEHHDRHSQDYYYEVRGSLPQSKLQKAARTLYLNRTCWNGLYRLNKQGQFNVPIGTKTQVVLPGDDFQGASLALKNADLKCQDFEQTISMCGDGDLLFVDPPYTVAHNNNGFVKYNEKIFSWGDQVRLRTALEIASANGASIVVTNADHESVRELYVTFGHSSSISRKSVISGKSHGRTSITELLVRI